MTEQQVTPDEAHDIGWSKGHIQGFREGQDEVLRELRLAANDVRTYVETGGEAYEVIRAHRALAQILGEKAAR